MLNTDDIKQISTLLDNKLAPIKEELQQHGKMLKEHGKTLTQHGKLLKSFKKDQDTMLDMLDREQMHQKKRLIRVEEHLGLSSTAS